MTVYGQWIERWERTLTLKDSNRRILPFEWGTDWIGLDPMDGPQALNATLTWAKKAVEDSETFYHTGPPSEVVLKGNELSFPTPTPSPILCNNTAYCRLFSARNSTRAAIVIPQWNALRNSHVTLCKVLQTLGYTTLRLTLPYHEKRLPEGMVRADYMVSPNIGRTLHANRQAVLEVIQSVEWLKNEGFQTVAVVGTSIGSCIGYLAFVHEPRIDVGVFNHVSSYYADVVWTGLSTRYVRWGLEGFVRLDHLRQCWAPLSPWFFVDRLLHSWRPHLMITARHDLSFLPKLSELVFEKYRNLGIQFDHQVLPCGHYTTGVFPFKLLDGYLICRYLRAPH